MIVRFLQWLFNLNRSVNYYAYINSPAWKNIARRCKVKAGMRCKRCGKSGTFYSLHAHHVTYSRLGHERLSDLECLCAECHERVSR